MYITVLRLSLWLPLAFAAQPILPLLLDTHCTALCEDRARRHHSHQPTRARKPARSIGTRHQLTDVAMSTPRQQQALRQPLLAPCSQEQQTTPAAAVCHTQQTGCSSSGADSDCSSRCPCSGFLGDASAGCTCSHLLLRGAGGSDASGGGGSVLSLCVCSCRGCGCNSDEAISQVRCQQPPAVVRVRRHHPAPADEPCTHAAGAPAGGAAVAAGHRPILPCS